LVIAAVYLALGALYTWAVPPWQGADELAHFGYVAQLARGGGLPRLGQVEVTSSRFTSSYEAHQPPLYYLLCVPVFAGTYPLGPHAATYALRAFSLLIGLGTGALAYRAARLLLPGVPQAAWGAAGMALLLPSQTSLFATVNNDCLTELLFSLALVLTVVGITKGTSMRLAVVTGVVVGLGILTKATCLLLLPLCPLGLLLAPAPAPAARHSQQHKSPAWHAAVCFAVALLVSGWWLWRNTVLYGDPMGMKALEAYFSRAPKPDYFLRRVGLTYGQYWMLVATWGWKSFFASFPGIGNRTMFLPVWLYWLYGLTWLAAIAGAASAIRQQTDEGRRRATLLLAGAAALLLASYARLNSVFFWAQARYIMPGVVAFAVAWAGGLARVIPPRLRTRAMAAVLAFLAAASVVAVFAVIRPHFSVLPFRQP